MQHTANSRRFRADRARLTIECAIMANSEYPNVPDSSSLLTE